MHDVEVAETEGFTFVQRATPYRTYRIDITVAGVEGTPGERAARGRELRGGTGNVRREFEYGIFISRSGAEHARKEDQ